MNKTNKKRPQKGVTNDKRKNERGINYKEGRRGRRETTKVETPPPKPRRGRKKKPLNIKRFFLSSSSGFRGWSFYFGYLLSFFS